MKITSHEFRQNIDLYFNAVNKVKSLEIVKNNDGIYTLRTKRKIIYKETKWEKVLKDIDKERIIMQYPKGIVNIIELQRSVRD